MDWLLGFFRKSNTLRYSVQDWRHGQMVVCDGWLTGEFAQAMREHAGRMVAAPIGERIAIGFDLWAVRTA